MVPDVTRRAVVQLAGLAAVGSLAGCAFVPGDPDTEETTETFDAAGSSRSRTTTATSWSNPATPMPTASRST